MEFICELVQSLWKSVWSFSENKKLELSHDPTISLLRLHLTKFTSYSTDTWTTMFIAALVTKVRTSNQTAFPPINDYTMKM